MAASPRHAVGIDVGGTKIAAGLVAVETGTIIAHRREPTRAERPGEDVLSAVLDVATDLLREAVERHLTVSGIGVAVAELVSEEGIVTSGHTIAWQGLPVRERLARLAPTVVDADVRAAARAEARFGAGSEADPFLYVSVGTGIASCLVIAGRPYAGARGNAHVLGTAAPFRHGEALEQLASGAGLLHRFNAHPGGGAESARDVLGAAERGDGAALRVVYDGADALGAALAHLVNVMDPTTLVIGGGLGCAPGPFWERLVPATRAGIWAPASRDLPITQAATGPDAGMVGAALAIDALLPEGGSHHATAG